MIDTLNYNEVPFHFVHCFRTECPKVILAYYIKRLAFSQLTNVV